MAISISLQAGTDLEGGQYLSGIVSKSLKKLED